MKLNYAKLLEEIEQSQLVCGIYVVYSQVLQFWVVSYIGEMLPIFFLKNHLISLSFNLCRCSGESLLHIARAGLLLVFLVAMLTTMGH